VGVSAGLLVAVVVGLDVGSSDGVSAYASPAPIPPAKATVLTPAKMIFVKSFMAFLLDSSPWLVPVLDTRSAKPR
jgi:hypothetical protein